ncbi:MAG TPA: hypothetical protein VJC18_04195, partial [bacterium]|nr:hypothetical protein [bacterium]
MYKFHISKLGLFCCLFVLLAVLSTTSFADDADEDYQAYESTKYASSKWDAQVKQGMEAYHS